MASARQFGSWILESKRTLVALSTCKQGARQLVRENQLAAARQEKEAEEMTAK